MSCSGRSQTFDTKFNRSLAVFKEAMHEETYA
jgi:hypothetical protein